MISTFLNPIMIPSREPPVRVMSTGVRDNEQCANRSGMSALERVTFCNTGSDQDGYSASGLEKHIRTPDTGKVG